jgi:hypothetical protein
MPCMASLNLVINERGINASSQCLELLPSKHHRHAYQANRMLPHPNIQCNAAIARSRSAGAGKKGLKSSPSGLLILGISVKSSHNLKLLLE